MTTRLPARHQGFLGLLVLGLVLRLTVLLGFRWQLWFNDSWSYVESAVRNQPHIARPNGYAFVLQAFRPFHAYWPVIVLQHLLALAGAVLIYALLLRRGVRRWVACLAAAPLLLDAYELELEHLLLSDTVFLFLVLALVSVLLWPGARGPWAYAGVGALLAAAALTRSIGLVLVPLVLLWMIRRTGWRSFASLLAACAVPLAGYAFWFSSAHGRYALTNSDGPFLYARAMAFADCSRFEVPAEERPLCDERPVAERPSSQFYVWGADSPLTRIPGDRFSSRKNELAGNFARRAIAAQPLDYLRVVTADVVRVFRWDRPVYPDSYTYSQYQFGTATKPVPSWAEPSLRAYTGGSLEPTRIVRPYATVMEWYQRYFYVRGTLLLALLAVPLVWRRWDAALPWSMAWAFLVVPAVTVEFDYRYILPAVPLAALAAALSYAGRRA